MAIYEKYLTGDFDAILLQLHRAILEASASATFENSSEFRVGEARTEVRVYERYSWFGNNRVSLTLTLCGAGGKNYLSAITAGGSQAMFFKLNTLGEEAFLDTVVQAVKAL